MRREVLFGLAIAVVCIGFLLAGVWILVSGPRRAPGPPLAPSTPPASPARAQQVERKLGEFESDVSSELGEGLSADAGGEAQAARTSLPAPRGDVFGRATGPDGKVPEGLRVWIVPLEGLEADSLRSVWANKRAVAYFVEHRTEADRDESGAFAVADVEPGSYLVVAWAPGLARAHAVIEHEIEPTRCDIEMETGQVLTGSVLNSAGDPIPGAKVEAQLDYHTGAGLNWGETTGEIFAVMSCREVGFADAHGRFRLDTLPKGQYLIWGSARDYSEERANAVFIPPTKEMTIRLFEGGALRATVSDERKAALPDAGVYVWDAASAWLLARDLTGPDGRVEFGRLPVGVKIAVAAKDGFALSAAPVAIRAGAQERVGFVLAPARDAWVAVLLEDGTPVPGVMVSVSRGGVPVRRLVFRGDWVRDDLPWVTDGEGRCHLTSLGPGRYDVRVAADGKAVEKPLTVPANGAAATLTLIVPQDS